MLLVSGVEVTSPVATHEETIPESLVDQSPDLKTSVSFEGKRPSAPCSPVSLPLSSSESSPQGILLEVLFLVQSRPGDLNLLKPKTRSLRARTKSMSRTLNPKAPQKN